MAGSLFIAALIVIPLTFWYTWLFNHTGGSVLMTLISHSVQGTITIGGLWAMTWTLRGPTCSPVSYGWRWRTAMVVFDRKAWRGPAAAETTTPPQAIALPTEAAPVTPA